jgi:hypothetical protein
LRAAKTRNARQHQISDDKINLAFALHQRQRCIGIRRFDHTPFRAQTPQRLGHAFAHQRMIFNDEQTAQSRLPVLIVAAGPRAACAGRTASQPATKPGTAPVTARREQCNCPA